MVGTERRDDEAPDDPAPLERVLLAKEQEHDVNVDGAPVYTRTLTAQAFTEMSRQAVIPTDPGAGFEHGAYTHRLQWWVIFSNADRLEHPPRDLLLKTLDPYHTPPRRNWPGLMEDGALSHLTELRTIIAARYNAKWGGSGDQRAAELVEQGLDPGLVEDRPGVFLPHTRSVTDEDVELVT